MSLFIATLFLLASLAAGAAPAPCDPNTLPSTIDEMKAVTQENIIYLFAEGVRFYDCSTGTPSLSSGGLVNITDGGYRSGDLGSKFNWTGTGVYPDFAGNGTFVLGEIETASGKPTGKTFNLTLNYATVLFLPSPDGALDWARWNVFTSPEDLQEELGIGWGERVDTVGGGEPKDCSAMDEDNIVIVPYTAIYNFYACPKSDANSPAAAPAPSPSSAGYVKSIMNVPAVIALLGSLAALV